MTLRRRNTVPPNMLLSSIASWGDGVMAPPFLPLRHYAPSQVTEDTPPDLLEGTMDLEVTLPNGQVVVMSVHRSTPMMDLLIQVTTAHRINPGGHVIQVISDNIFLTYKPSTPIGTLDTNAIKIVSKNALNEMTKARKSNLQQEAIERNIRLKPKEWVYKQQLVVNLPRNQLAVYRVPPKSLISEIFSMVCEDKNLDPETHEIRHPANVDERLRGSCSLSDYQLQEVCVVSSDFRPPPLSVTDLITMSSIAHPEDKKRRGIFGIFSRKAKSSTGDSSVSSGSAGERSVSPARSDESAEGRPSSQAQTPTSSSATLTNVYHKSNVTVTSSDRNSLNSTECSHISRPVSMISLNKTKKRPAPVPPQRVKRTTDEQTVNEKINSGQEKTNLSRHNSDSSGYHEQERKSLQTSPSCSEVGSIDANRSVLRPTSNLTSVSNSSSTASVKIGKRKAPSPPRPSVTRNGRTSPSSIPESPEGNETKQILEVCEETATNGDSSHVSVTESSENLTNEKVDQSDCVKLDSCQMNISENSFNNLEHSSSQSKLQTVDKVSTTQNSSTENSLSEQAAVTAASEVVKEECYNEIIQASVVEPYVEKTALESTESPVVANSSSSSSPPLVASGKGSTINNSSTENFAAPLPLLPHSTNSVSPYETNPSKSTEAASNSETVLVTASSHSQKPLSASMPASSNAFDPKKQDDYSSLKFNFSDRLNSDDPVQTRQKDDISSDKNLKINTLPRSAKKKILKIIPIFSTISRFNKEKHRKSFDLNTLGKFYNNDDDNKNNDSSNNTSSVKTVTKNGSDIDINNSVNAEKPTSYNIIIQNSSSNNNINNNNNNSNNNNEQINYDSNVGKVVAVESIFQVSSTYEKMKIDAPVPAPRKALQNMENSMPNKIDNLSESSENSMKSLKDNNLIEGHVSENEKCGNSFENDSKIAAVLPDDEQEMLCLTSKENRDFYEISEKNLEEGSSLGVQNDTVKSTPHIDKGESECEFHLDRTLTSTTGKMLAHSECSSSPIQDSSSSLCSDSENEAKTRTVGLSSETSYTSIEMMNPKDIQRPKRHRRKKIPEVFMKNSASISSDVSNDSAHTVGNDHVDSVSTSLQPPKNFENVRKEAKEETIEPINVGYSTGGVCNDGFEEMDPRSNAQSDLKIVNERLKEVPKDSHSDCNNKNAQLSVIYIEDLNGEESTTDPLTPPIPKKKKFTTKLQLSTGEQVSSISKEENNNVGLQSLSNTEVNRKSINENSHNCSSKFSNSCKEDVMAELKSTIENPDVNSDHRPIILNLKQKENRDWDIGKASEYNLILDVNKKNGGDSYASDNTFVRSASASSYESFDTNSIKKSNPSTETSYESVPPPLPDSRIPQASDCDSKTSSVLSRQSSFSDNDSVEFTKPNAPAFSISTYESRASKLSYNKKLSRSGSLASFKDIQTTEFSPSDDRKLNRSDSQRNEVFRSDNLKKKCTSTTFLNLTSNKDDDERISFNSNIRPSLIKSRSRASLLENGSDFTDTIDDMSRTIQFDVSSSKEPITFTRPLPLKTYNNLRKAKSQLDISNDNRMAEGYQGIPDSGLANEYMRLQDDFVKWQQQLLQNQQLLHNRVAPIAANPPVLNSTGLVNNMLNQSTPAVPQQQQQQQRKPVEITIPIRLVDSDEEDSDKTPQPKLVSNQAPQRNTQVNNTSSSRWNGPNVSIDSWQERPSYVVITQPTVIEPTAPRPFANQPRMQTVFQSTPNEWQSRDAVLEKPQTTQQRQQNTIAHPPQNVSRPEFYQGQRQEDNVTYPQPNISRPEFYKPNQPKPNFTQEPPSQYRQMPPHTKFQEVPQQNHFRNENSQEQLQNFEPQQPIYNQTQVYNSNSVPESNGKKFSEQNPPFATRSFPQNFNRPQQAVSPPVVDKSGDGINARFSSVVTLSNDKNDQNVPQKDKVRSVVQLNNSSPQIGQSPAPFLSKIINAASNKDVNNRECDGPISFQPSDTSSVAPMSSRLVQQAVQQPYGGCRVSPPKVEQRYSPPKFEQRFSPPKIEQHYQTPTIERQPSPPNSEPSLPFGEVKLRHVESPRVSPPKISAPEPLVAPPPPPPPPPSKANAGPSAPPPPPPPPAMSEADRRAATGKKILGAAYTPQLDAREELMMAIRQFGGSQKLRKSAHPPPH